VWRRPDPGATRRPRPHRSQRVRRTLVGIGDANYREEILIPLPPRFRMAEAGPARHHEPMLSLRPFPLSACLAGLLLAPGAFGQKAADPAAEAFFRGPAWAALLAATDGGWHVDWNAATGTPRAIYGRGLPIAGWRENSLDTARRHANELLRERAEMLGLGSSDFREAIGARMGRTWSFVFDQYFRGLPCIGGRADVRISMAGRVAMFGSAAWQLADDFDVTPALTPEAARLLALQALVDTQQLPADAERTVDEPKLVIWGDVHATTRQTPVLAYEVPANGIGAGGVGPQGRYYVDARTGTVLHFTSDKHECGLHCNHAPAEPSAPAAATPSEPAPRLPSSHEGTAAPAPVPTGITVLGVARTSRDALAAPVLVPMTGLEIVVPGHGTYVTDDNGEFTVDLLTPAIINIAPLDGRHHQAITGPGQPAGAFQLIPGVSGTVQLSTLGASENTTAHLTAAWWTDRTNEFVRSVLGDTPQLDSLDSLAIEVNVALTCNAYYNGPSLVFYAAGGGCTNMAQSTVIAHEWGHGLDDRYGGISQTNGLGEGWADVVSMYLTDDPVSGLNLFGPGTSVRTGTNTRQFPSGTIVHEQGETWMGFAWKLRERLALTRGRPTAIAITNDIVLGSIVADAVDQPSALLEVWLADDNDGDLTNGTPNAAELIWAADQHALPDPAPAGLPNDACTFPFQLTNGLNGPYANTGATSALPMWNCATGANDVWFSYAVGAAGTLDISTCGNLSFDTVIQVFQGNCGTLQSVACNDDACIDNGSRVFAPVQPGIYLIRVGGYFGATGTFSLQVSGPSGAYGTAAPFGVACGTESRSFYELFPRSGFDLSGTSMRLVLSGDHYVVQAGGSFVPPPANATDLGLGDENAVLLGFALPQPFPVPGGSVSALLVNANGYVSAGSSQLQFAPTATDWLGVGVRCWGVWHDLDASAAGSGRVKRHAVGDTIYVTWDGVFGYERQQPNRFQIQLHQNTGDVTIAFQTMAADAGGTIVGFAAGGGSSDLGSRDLSATVPATFRTGAADRLPPALTSNLPRLGQTLTLTTTFATGVPFGLQLLGLQALDPGVPLDAIGLIGCRQHASADVLAALVPVGGIATYTLPIPTDGSLLGFVLAAQSAAVMPTANPFGFGMSRGLRLTVGL
jgi:hypothetical protein